VSRRGYQPREQRDNQNGMSMTMLIKLQEEFEMLKKINEEEFSMLRVENAYMR